MKEKINLPETALREGSVSDEDISYGSDEVIESAQSRTEESLDEFIPAASPKEVTAFESVENVPKPVSHFLVPSFTDC